MRQSVARAALGGVPTAHQPAVMFTRCTGTKRRRSISICRATDGGDASERCVAPACALNGSLLTRLYTCRSAKDLLRRAAELRAEQAALAEELAAAAAGPLDSPDRAALEAALRESGLDPAEALGASLAYDPSAGEVPPGPLRSELERLLGLRPPEDPFDPLAAGPPAEEAEALARAIEEGRATTEAPPGFFPPPAESGDQFLARLDASRARFVEMLGSGKDRAAARRARRGATGEREDEREEEDALRRMISEEPTFPSELTDSLAVPDIPPEAAAQFHRSQRALLVLRRALMDDGHPPGAGIAGLKARGLAAPELTFEDPWVALEGRDAAESYLDGLAAAGATIELDTLFAQYTEYRPDVRCHLVAHTYITVPLPGWYLARLALHGQPPPPPDDPASTAPRWRPGEAVRQDADPPGGLLYPRRPPSEPSAAAAAGRAHLRWLVVPAPVAARRQVPVGRSEQDYWGLEVRGAGGGEGPRPRPTRRPDYSALPPAGVLASAAGFGWYAPPRDDPPRPPPLPRAAPAEEIDLEEDPLSPDEVEQLLRALLGDADFDRAAAQLPAKKDSPWVEEPGGDSVLAVGATWRYEVDPASGAVTRVEVAWSWVQGPFAEQGDAYDVYVEAAGLMEAAAAGTDDGDDDWT